MLKWTESCAFSKRQNAKFLIRYAETYYSSALRGANQLPFILKHAIKTSLYCYREIGMQILKSTDYPERSNVSLFKKILILPGLWVNQIRVYQNKTYVTDRLIQKGKLKKS